MRYAAGSWHRPYGARDDGAEGLGFGRGEGTVSGEIARTLVWANYPAVVRTACGHQTCAA